MAAGALRIFNAVLEYYIPHEADFVEAGQKEPVLSSRSFGLGRVLHGPALAGFQLIRELLGESPAQTLWSIFAILEKGVTREQREKKLTQEQAEAMTDALLLSLKIIEQLFRKQVTFPTRFSTPNIGQELFVINAVFNTRVEDLMLDVDISHHRTPRVLHVAHFVSHACEPELALQAVKILWWLSRSATAQPKLASIFRSHVEPDRSITLHAFEQRLGDVRPEHSMTEPTCTDVLDEGHVHVCNAISFSILHLLLYNLAQGAPNLAHLLLGFPLIATTERDIAQASLLARDASGSTRSCLHAILELVGQGVGQPANSGSRLTDTNPELSELCHKV